MKVVAYVPDLMDRSKVAAAADVTFVREAAALAGADADLVVVDLNRPGVLDVLPAISARTIGFGSHVQRDVLDAARAAGCDVVLKRSEFFAQLPNLLQKPAP